MRKSILLFLFSAHYCAGQYNQMARNAFLHRDITQAFDYWNIASPGTVFHSAFKPYLSSTFTGTSDSALPFKFYSFNNQFFSRTFNEKPEKRNWFNLQIHPILDAEAGYDGLRSRPLSSVAGGSHLKLNINDDFTFAATLVGGSYQFPFYADSILRGQRIIPEFGQAYRNAHNSGYNFFDYQGYASYSPKNNKRFNFQAGRDKHFIGDGYRSVLLSDYAPAYPYLRINANVWRLQYNVWYTWMLDVSQAGGLKNNYRNKYGTFHYLSYNILRELNIGIFENVIWRGTDTNQVRNFDVSYLNPVILFRPIEYSLGSPDNSFLGLNLNFTLFRRIKCYGQIGLDEFYLKEIRAGRGWWANKQAWQLGAKYINAFGIKGLMLQAEYNQARPYTYSHGVADQNYAHLGMPLAHPLGANFKETLGFVSYRRHRLLLSAQLMYAVSGRDPADSVNMGQNIFKSYVSRPYEYGHFTGQGIRTEILQSQLRLAWFLLPDLNMRLELGYIQRALKNDRGHELQNPYVFVGIKTSFWNSYRDF